MGRSILNTTLDAEILQKLRIQSVIEGRPMKDILEELILEYLKRYGTK